MDEKKPDEGRRGFIWASVGAVVGIAANQLYEVAAKLDEKLPSIIRERYRVDILPYLDQIKACENRVNEIQSKLSKFQNDLSNTGLLETEYNTELKKAYEDLDDSITGAEEVVNKYKPILGSDALLVEDTMLDLLKKYKKERSQHQEQISQLNSQITTLNDRIEGSEEKLENAKKYLSLISSTLYIIPSLIPDFKPFEKIPERIYQGRDLSGWEITVGDSVWVPPGHESVSLRDIETINYGDYSELKANIRRLPIMAHNITYFKVFNEKSIFDHMHIASYKFRHPFLPVATEQEFNTQILGGGFSQWYGPKKTGYDIGFGWGMNPWDPTYLIDVWEGQGSKIVGKMEPDTNRHTVIFFMNQKHEYSQVERGRHSLDVS